MDSEARQTRLRRREQEPEEDEEHPPLDDDAGADDAELDGDDEEVTRCLCRKQEYPGAPVPVNDSSKNYSPTETSPSGGLDVGGDMFIQCDGCKVWQHGGCVGIMNESMSPEEYYCEECKKDLHKVMTGARGQRYSRYLPVYEAFSNIKPSRHSPPSKDKDTDSRASKDPETKGMSAAAINSAKKRSTMNSRAALDEEEMLRKAIEESKAEGSLSTAGSSVRKAKRGRDDSEDMKQDLKRRKTASDPDSLPDPDVNGEIGSDEDTQSMRSKPGNGLRKPRVAPAQTQKEKDKELRDMKEKERERIEAAGRRKGRAERRNIEEREAAEEAAKTTPIAATKAAAIPKLARQATTPKIPQSTPPVLTASPSHRKNVKAAPKRGRVGRNQYTRDRDEQEDAAETARPQTRDSDKGAQADEIASTTQQSRNAKMKSLNPNRTSMNELKKRVAGMMEFISRTQIELAGEKTPTNGAPQHNGSSPQVSSTNGPPNGLPSNGVPPSTAAAMSRPSLLRTASIKGATSKLREQINGDEKEAPIEDAVFGAMSSHEMLDVLTRRLVHWQKDHGKFGEKV